MVITASADAAVLANKAVAVVLSEAASDVARLELGGGGAHVIEMPRGSDGSEVWNNESEGIGIWC